MCCEFATRRVNVTGQNFTRCMSSLLSQTRVKSIKIDEHTCIIHLLDNMSLAGVGWNKVITTPFLVSKDCKKTHKSAQVCRSVDKGCDLYQVFGTFFSNLIEC